MAETAPYGASPRLAVAISGGADSLALALLADGWAKRHDGSIIGLIADHGLRASSADEARDTAERLAARQIKSRIIPLDLPRGAALQARARAARHAALTQAARQAGAVHLLLGHHQRDQVETSMMRGARGSRGLAGMAAFTASRDVIVLRPLLRIDAAALRDFLRASGCGWVEDPSNIDARFERVRVRGRVGQGDTISLGAIHHAGRDRHEEMQDTARQLAGFGGIYAEGFALWRALAMPVDVLAALLRVVGGKAYTPNREAVARLAASLRPTTLGGVQVTKWRGAWLLTREAAVCGPPVEAQPGGIWDGRFRIIVPPKTARPRALYLGALGPRAAEFRKISHFPSLILRSLPAVHDCEDIIAVPHLGFGVHCDIVFEPSIPAAPLAFALHHLV